MSILSKIITLAKQLYPTGRAFKMPVSGDFEKLNSGLAASEKRAWDDAVSILNSALPDNDAFTADDATAWERRLGLITNDAVPLADRKMAIIRKMNHPGDIPTRQNYLYLQGQLQAAGFDVYVYENRFDDGGGGFETHNPEVFSPGYPMIALEHSPLIEHGEIEHGSDYANKIANSLEQAVDDYFDVGDNFVNTFFIGGSVAGTFANVSEERETEFRQLILNIKPTHSVGFLLINYI